MTLMGHFGRDVAYAWYFGCPGHDNLKDCHPSAREVEEVTTIGSDRTHAGFKPPR